MFNHRRQVHEHQWISVSSSTDYIRKRLNSIGEPSTMPYTLILQRCRCGANQTTEIDGHWTHEELGINDDTVRDLMALLNETGPADA